MTRFCHRAFLRLLLPLAMVSLLFLPGSPLPKPAAQAKPARARTAPTLSGALPAYPLNHVLDSNPGPAGTPPTNSDFETPPSNAGTPPTNSDMSQPMTTAGTPETNPDFETGTLSGWTTTGTPTIQTDTPHGHYASLPSGASITSAPFTVDQTTQTLSFDIGYLDASNYSWVKAYVLSGSGYATSTALGDFYCYSCGRWDSVNIDATPYRGQSIKLSFSEYSGTPGIDNVLSRVLLPGYTVSGSVSRATDPGGFNYVKISSGGITTPAFTVASTAQTFGINLSGLGSTSPSYKVKVHSGAGLSTLTDLGPAYTPATWQTVHFDASAYAGQTIALEVDDFNGTFGVTRIGSGWVDVPGWTTGGVVSEVNGGVTGQAVQMSGGGSVTSPALSITTTEQQVSLSYKAIGGPGQFNVDILSGTGFATATTLSAYIVGDQTKWQTLKVGVGDYAGQQIKLRIRQYNYSGLYDNVGLGETVVPGWTPQGTAAIQGGTDANGSYLTQYAGSQGPVLLKSSTIQTNMITSGGTAAQYFAIAYDLCCGNGALMNVTWFNAANGQNWVVYQDASNSDTGYKLGYLPVNDFMGTSGYFVVKISGGTKLYSVADNAARQALAEPFSQKVGLQVDTSTGAFGFSEQDLSLSGPSPLVFSRYYAGHSDRTGSLGYRWSHSYDTRLYLAGTTGAGVVFGSGKEAFFTLSGSSYSPADARVHDTLVKNGDGTYTYTTTQNLAYKFSSAGVLQSITDLKGNATSLAYDPTSGLLTSVTDPGGRKLMLSYDGSNRLTSVTDPTGAIEKYSYTTDGDLGTATDPNGGVRTYSYSQHRLTGVVDQNGKTLFTNTLDSVNRVTKQTDASGKTITIAYETPGAGETQVTDPNGGVADYFYDTHHRTSDKTDPLGHTVSYIFDSAGNVQKVVDPANNSFTFAYDASGMTTSSTDPLNNALQIAYNPQHLPTTVTDPLGNVTSNAYDGAGNLVQQTDPLGNVTKWTYDAHGNVLSLTNPLNQTESYTYDGANNRVTKTDALGNVWRWAYDATGRVTATQDSLGNTTQTVYDPGGRPIKQTDALNRQTVHLYDGVGHLLQVQDPTGATTQYTYDARGLGVSATDPAGNVTTFTYDNSRNTTGVTDPLHRSTAYTYDAANRMTSVTDAAGDATSYSYDAAGLLASVRDPLGRTTSYNYDGSGRLTTETLPNGATIGNTYDAAGHLTATTDALGRTTSYTYDKAGRKASMVDPAGKTTSYTYDAAGRLTTVTDPLGGQTVTSYDAAGRVTAVKDPAGNTTGSSYDAAGRRTKVTDALGHATTYTYDAAGQQAGMTDPLGHAATSAYDGAGRLTSVTAPSGAATSYAYDPRGLLTKQTDPLGHATSYAYDAAGQQLSMTDPLGGTTQYGYDAAGRQTSITDALNGVVQFTFDAAGQQTAVTNANGKKSRSTYDALGDQLSETDPLGHTKTSSFDKAGRMTGWTDARGTSVQVAYDALDNQTAVTYPGGSVQATYDALGRRTSMTDATGTTSWSYDAASRITSVAAPQGTVTYGYNADGSRATMTLPGGKSLGYGYDAAGRLTALTDFQNRSISFGYDADGNRTGISRPNGVTTSTTFDAAGNVSGITHAGPGGTLRSFSYTRDANGNPTAVALGTANESYTYDKLGRLTGATYANGDTAGYSYDAAGNRLTSTANGTTTSFTYNDADQLLSDGTTSYSYDPAGNLTAAGANSFSWDWANRLTSATVSGTATNYAYDGDGVRTSKTSGGTSTSSLWDREGSLPQLVDDGSQSYLSADGVQGQVDRSGSATYYLGDALGSVRGRSDATGTLTGSADYDAFGVPRAHTGPATAFGYTGEQTDPESGYSFLRARSYTPVLGRFLSADSISPNAPGTQGYNLYAYVANDPTRWVDPSGHLADPIPAASAIWDAISVTTTETETFAEACGLSAGCAGLVAAGSAVETAAAFVPLVAGIYATFAILICELDTGSSGSWSSSSGPAGTVWEFSVHTWGCMTSWDTYTRLALRLGSPGQYSPTPHAPPLPRQLPLPGFPPPSADDENGCGTPPPTGPYANVPDLNVPIRPGKDWDDDQRAQLIHVNKARHGGVLVSDGDGLPLVEGDKNNPRAVQIDHICPRYKKGPNRNYNACVLSRKENRDKWYKPPYTCPPFQYDRR